MEAFALGSDERVQAFSKLDSSVNLSVKTRPVRKTGVAVQKAAVIVRGKERLMLMLTMDVDEES
jgi:hypothetical protein